MERDKIIRQPSMEWVYVYKGSRERTFEITIQATKPGELWCYHPIRLPAYWKTQPDKERRNHSLCLAAVFGLSTSKEVSTTCLPVLPHQPHTFRSPSRAELWCLKYKKAAVVQYLQQGSSGTRPILYSAEIDCCKDSGRMTVEDVLLCCHSLGPWPKGEHFWGLCCWHTVPMFRTSLPWVLGLNTLCCWCFLLVLTLEKENQPVTNCCFLKKKTKTLFSTRKDTSERPSLSFF